MIHQPPTRFWSALRNDRRQLVAARLGCATKRHLAEHCRDAFDQPLRLCLWALTVGILGGPAKWVFRSWRCSWYDEGVWWGIRSSFLKSGLVVTCDFEERYDICTFLMVSSVNHLLQGPMKVAKGNQGHCYMPYIACFFGHDYTYTHGTTFFRHKSHAQQSTA